MMKSIMQWWGESPRKAHVGLSLDDSNSPGSESSSILSDFEEGMPLWVKQTPTSTNYSKNNHEEEEEDTNTRIPLGYQVHLPTCRPWSSEGHNNNKSADDTSFGLVQRSNLKRSLSLPSLTNIQDSATTSAPKLELLRLSNTSTGHSTPRHSRRYQRLANIFFLLLGVSMVVDSVNQELSGDILSADVYKDITRGKQPEFPSYSFPQYQMPQQRKKPFEASAGKHTRRSNLALARPAESRPVFGSSFSPPETITSSSTTTTSSWFSWMGTCAVVAVFLEASLTIYHRSSKRQSMSQAQYRL